MEYTILIVDDEASCRDLIARVLRNKGMRLVLADNGRDALSVLEQEPRIHAVILDLSMPDMDGRACCMALRSDARFATCPVLMVSGSPDLERDARLAGADATLAKPFQPSALIARLTELLQASNPQP